MIWFLTGPFLYLAASVFWVGAAWKVIALARMPRHLRWELYPIPRMGDKGSMHQGDDPRDVPRLSSFAREVAFMLQEILALKKVFAGRRDLWLGSMLLHAGLYLGIVFLVVLACGAIWLAPAGDPAGRAEPLPASLLYGATGVLGACSLVAGLAGAVYLVALRLADRGLREMSDRITYFNLLLLAAMFGSGLLAWLADPGWSEARAHLASLFRGRPGVVESPWLASAMAVAGGFAIYLPFSRMFHFAAKYFFYHAILWDDRPMQHAGRMEREVTGCLGNHVTWSAAHIKQDRSWREQVAAGDDEKGTGA